MLNGLWVNPRSFMVHNIGNILNFGFARLGERPKPTKSENPQNPYAAKINNRINSLTKKAPREFTPSGKVYRLREFFDSPGSYVALI